MAKCDAAGGRGGRREGTIARREAAAAVAEHARSQWRAYLGQLPPNFAAWSACGRAPTHFCEPGRGGARPGPPIACDVAGFA